MSTLHEKVRDTLKLAESNGEGLYHQQPAIIAEDLTNFYSNFRNEEQEEVEAAVESVLKERLARLSQKPPSEVIRIIAEYCNSVAWQSGTAGIEAAGQFVSVLAAHPEYLDDFLDSPSRFHLDNFERMQACDGCLSWYARGTGPEPQIVTPAEYRAETGRADN